MKTGITKTHCQCTKKPCRGRDEAGKFVRVCSGGCSHLDRYRVRKRMPNGKQVERWCLTVDEAEGELLKLEQDARAQKVYNKLDELGAFHFEDVAQRWLADVEHSVDERTVDEYRRIVDKVLMPEFGGRLIKSISQRDVQDLVNTWSGSGGKGKGLAPQTVRNRINVLVPILHEGGNPVTVGRGKSGNRGVKLPTKRKAGGVEVGAGRDVVANRLYLQSEDELATLVGALPVLYRLMSTFMGFAGTRPGETLELRADDINSEGKGRVTVSRAAKQLTKRLPGGRYRVGSTKTGKHREVAVRIEILDAIKATVMLRHGVSEWSEVPGDALLFSEDGRKHLDYDKLTKEWRATVVAALPARLRALRLYDLRHTCASILANQGAPIHLVANQLGHSNPNITATIYSHLFESTTDSLLDRLEGKVGRVLEAAVA